jgi:hypothetical protein
MDTHFASSVFPLEQIDLAGETETILVGGRHLFPLLPQALRGVDEIGVLGWGPQGSAQAQNLRDSLQGSGIKVSVGLREGSASREPAEAAGFSERATGPSESSSMSLLAPTWCCCCCPTLLRPSSVRSSSMRCSQAPPWASPTASYSGISGP